MRNCGLGAVSYTHLDVYKRQVNNNAISEDLEKEYFCLLLNPFANVPINKTRLSGIKYFELDNTDDNYATFRWHNL